MPSPRRLLAVGAAVAALAVAGCSQDSADTAGAEGTPSSAVSAGSTVAVAEDAVIVDVRTPAEYAEGHVDGAVNIDVQDPAFAERIESLDEGAPTFVYCRTGNRSAAAAAQMTQAGFTDVTDLGSVEDAARATGLPVVD